MDEDTVNVIEVDTKETIKKKLASGNCKLLATKNGKAGFWNNFEKIVYVNNNAETGFVSCIKCKVVMSYLTNKGNSHLNRHKCALLSTIAHTSSMDSFVTKKKKIVPMSTLNDCKKACVQFCSRDIRPMDIVAGPGFINLANYLIKVGSQFGEVSAEDLLPHPTTVKRHLLKIAEYKRNLLINFIKPFIEMDAVSATTDMWTDNYKKRTYISLTLHYISDWKLSMNVVYTGQFPIDERKTGENIRKCLKTFFLPWNIEPAETNVLSRLTWVTDQGSNIKSALESFERINCSAHMLNNVLKHTFDNKFLLGNNERCVTLPIFKMINAIKSLVGYMKRTGDVNKLSKTLTQEIDIRWNTRLLMLISVGDQYEEITKLYINEPYRFQDIDCNLLEKVIKFLIPFKEASDELEGDLYPTLHKVLLYKFKIEKHISSYIIESNSNEFEGRSEYDTGEY